MSYRKWQASKFSICPKQETNIKVCAIFNYNVYMELYAGGPCSTFGDKLNLDVNQSCTPGYNISQEESACICVQALQKCTNITNGLGQITRDSSDTFWIGYDTAPSAVWSFATIV